MSMSKSDDILKVVTPLIYRQPDQSTWRINIAFTEILSIAQFNFFYRIEKKNLPNIIYLKTVSQFNDFFKDLK